MALPNLIIAGPPKTGTTSLFDWLSQHADVLPSSVKETYYFYDSSNAESPLPNFNKDGWTKYEKFFDRHVNESIRMEASPGYIYSKLAAEKLSTIDDLKVIIVYRNAADRLFSEYQFNRYKTKKYQGTFSDYLGFDGSRFCGQTYNEANLNPFVEMWLNHIHEDQFRIIDFNDLKSNATEMLKKLALFLKIDEVFFETASLEKKNETFGLRNRKMHERALRLKALVPQSLQNFFTPIYYYFNKTDIPKISKEEQKMKEILSKSVEKEELAFKNRFQHLYL